MTLEATGGSEEGIVTASGEYEIVKCPAGFKVEATDKGVKISVGVNSGSQKTGTLTLTLNADRSKTAKITITQNQKATRWYGKIEVSGNSSRQPRRGREVSSADIRKWHDFACSQGGRGWKQVGYTDLFHLQGGVERFW